MKVIAVKTGFYGGSLRDPGAVFEVTGECPPWAKPAEEPKKKAGKAESPASDAQPETI